MKIFLKRIVIFFSLQIVILITSLLYYNKISLMYYINISFYFTSLLLLSSLLIYIIRTGFFDIAAKGFTKTFSRNREKRKLGDITPLSELVSINQKPLLLHGLLLGFCMLIGLIVYYV